MSRVYTTKGPEKLMHGPSVPMTDAMQTALREKAGEHGISVSEQVRRYITRGLEYDDAHSDTAAEA